MKAYSRSCPPGEGAEQPEGIPVESKIRDVIRESSLVAHRIDITDLVESLNRVHFEH